MVVAEAVAGDGSVVRRQGRTAATATAAAGVKVEWQMLVVLLLVVWLRSAGATAAAAVPSSTGHDVVHVLAGCW